MSVRILVGDAFVRLADLPDESVHVCVTSPPYFGLRDYGTASWSGGDPACDHVERRFNLNNGFNERWGNAPGERKQERGRIEQYRDSCPTCGAVREDRQIGSEPTLAAYVETMVRVFREVRRVLRSDGTVCLNLGDSFNNRTKVRPSSHQPALNGYTDREWKDVAAAGGVRMTNTADGLKEKDLMMVPARVAIALCDDGWYLRSDIIWAKKSCMPESVTDRPTSAHEHIFLLAKSPRYFYDAEAVREDQEPGTIARFGNGGAARKLYGPKHDPNGEPNVRSSGGEGVLANGRNLRNVWTLGPEPFNDWTATVRQVPVAWDEADDDTTRTPSLGCPVHAWTGRADPIRVGDERGDEPSSRTADSNARRGPAPVFGSVSIGRNRAGATPVESSDSLPLLRALSATPHSNGMSRMDPALATIPSCTPCGETTRHTGDTQASPASGALHPDMPESSTSGETSSGLLGTDPRIARTKTSDTPASLEATPDDAPRTDASSIWPDDSGARSPDQTTADTIDTPSCTCSFHKTITESISHFATFVTEIPRRAIKAGTSAKGCCPACGAPWIRQTAKIDTGEVHRKGASWDTGPGGHGAFHREGRAPVVEYAPVTRSETTGWAPSCRCAAGEPAPAVVLDPFLGAGTSLLVADQLGRDGIGIELNPAYATMAEQRIRGASPMFARVEVDR